MTLAKRAFDLLGASLLLIAAAPLLAVVALRVRRDGGPVIFRQRRVGLGGRPFEMLKIRSMVVDAEKHGLQLTASGDRRITPVGRWLRKTKADELPQLWNVLRGEMSLVGPRPEVQRYVDLYTPAQRAVLDLMPGITDPASLHYAAEEELLGRSEDPEALYVQTVMPDKIERNLRYARSANVFTDLGIVVSTALVPLRGRTAVSSAATGAVPVAIDSQHAPATIVSR